MLMTLGPFAQECGLARGGTRALPLILSLFLQTACGQCGESISPSCASFFSDSETLGPPSGWNHGLASRGLRSPPGHEGMAPGAPAQSPPPREGLGSAVPFLPDTRVMVVTVPVTRVAGSPS